MKTNSKKCVEMWETAKRELLQIETMEDQERVRRGWEEGGGGGGEVTVVTK